MGEHTYRLNRFAFYDRERIQKYLENMAQNGWILDKTGATLWRYRKESPRKIQVSIIYVADGSSYNPTPTSGEDLLEDLSADNGWQLLGRWDQMQIFFTEQENPVPLETDPVTQVESIRCCMKKKGIPTAKWQIIDGMILFGMMLFQLFTFPIDYLSQGFWVWMMPDAILIILMGVTSLVSWNLWYRKATDTALEGHYTSVWNARCINLILGAFSWIIGVLMILSFNGKYGFLALCFVPVIGIALFIKWLTKTMKDSGVKGKTNMRVGIGASIVMSLVLLVFISFIGIKYHMIFTSKPVGTYQISDREINVFADKIPLRVEDLMDTVETEWSTEEHSQESFLIAKHQYRQWPLTQEDMPEIDYQVIDIKASFVYDLCKNDLLGSRKDTVKNGVVLHVNHFESINPTLWGAKEAYQELWHDEFSSKYILCYEDKIVILNTNWDLTTDQMEIVGKTFS